MLTFFTSLKKLFFRRRYIEVPVYNIMNINYKKFILLLLMPFFIIIIARSIAIEYLTNFAKI